MTSKASLPHNAARYFLALVLVLGLAACAPRGIAPSPGGVLKSRPERSVQTKPPVERAPAEETPDPRLLASLQLTEQGRSLIENRQPDSAIRVLERAVSIDPSNGQNYYYLSEAWLLKGNTAQAANFNELASIHLGSGWIWRQRVADQERRIRYRQGQ